MGSVGSLNKIKIKVAIICPYPIEEFEDEISTKLLKRGSYPSSNVSLINGLSNIKEINLHVITLVRGLKIRRLIEKEGITFHFLKNPKFSGIASGFQWQRFIIHDYLRQLKPDIVHGIGTESGYTYYAVTSCMLNIITIRGIMKEIAKEESFLLPTVWTVKDWLERYTLNRASHVICISPHVKKILRSISRKPVYYQIDNAVDSVFFSIDSKPINNEKYLLFAGTIKPSKGLLDAVKVMATISKRFAKIKLLVIGSISDQRYYNKICEFIVSKGLNDRIVFLGLQSHKEIAKYFLKSVLMLFPSYNESFGNVIAEAMAASVPVVTTNAGAIPHLVKNGENGFMVNPGDIEGLADKVIRILKDPILRHKISRSSKEVAFQRWRSEIITQKTYEVYKKIYENTKKR